MEEFLSKLRDLLKDVENADMNAIETQLKNLVGSDDEKQKLINKNKDLISEKRVLQNKIKELEKEIDEFDTDELERLKAFEIEALSNPDANKKVDIEDIKAKIEVKWKNLLANKEKELEELKSNLTGTKKNLNNLLITQEIDKQFSTGKKVLDVHRTILRAHFKSKAKVEFDGDDSVVVIEDNGQELPIADYFEYWKGLEESKPYLEAEQSSGGGASGSKGGFTKKKAWKDMTPNDRITLYKENPAEYERMKNENKR